MAGKKILITNTVALNGGDAAILLALIKVLRESFGPETKILVYDSKPEIVAPYYPEIEFRPLFYTRFGALCSNRYLRFLRRHLGRWRFRLAFGFWLRGFKKTTAALLTRDELSDLKHYASADLVVSTGGTYLVETYDLAPRIFDYRITLALKRPLIFFTQSLGPFQQRRNRKAFADIFSRARLIILRDERSQQHVLEVAGPEVEINTRVGADIAFAFADPEVLTRAARPMSTTFVPRQVAISVRDWPYNLELEDRRLMPRYSAAIAALVELLVSEYQARVTFISTCQGIPAYWQDDSRVAAAMIKLLPAPIQSQVCLDDTFHHPEELLQILASYDLVVATRMHMAIIALDAGVPVLPIAYEFKTRELFRRLGQGIIPDIRTLTATSLTADLRSLIADYPARSQDFFSRVEAERQRALAQVAWIGD